MAKKDTTSKAERRLKRALARAIEDFDMIQDHDVIGVAVSGGKDSIVLHDLLAGLSKRAPVEFSVIALHVDQGMPGHDIAPLVEYMRDQGHTLHVETDATYPALRPLIATGKRPCPLCSRLRRAILYRVARSMGCTKLALGHHRQDVLTTLMLNLIFSGQLKAMPPKLLSDDGKNVVIRPLVFASQEDIQTYAEQKGLPVLPPPRCGVSEDSQRKVVENLLEQFERLNPGAQANMMAALANVRPSHLLDAGLWKQLRLGVAALDETTTEESVGSSG